MNCENVSDVQPKYMLLPICTEWKRDMFFNILKNIIARNRLDEHQLDRAFTLGMKEDELHIELEDVTMDWNQLSSDEQQIRQSKILGYWAVEHFPILVKKMCGGSWGSRSRQGIHIIGQPQKMSADEIDAIVFRKFKLRIMQLKLSKSTLDKLKSFIIDLPQNIGTYNEIQMTPKIKCFDIGQEYIQDSWKALKLGKFELDADFQQPVDLDQQLVRSTFLPHREMIERPMAPEASSNSIAAKKRAHTDTLDVNERNGDNVDVNIGESNIDTQSVSEPKRAHLDAADVHNGNNIEVNCDDSIEKVVSDMRKEIRHLTEFNRKDEEIGRLKACVSELRQANETLANDQTNTKEQIEQKAALIIALSHEVDSTSKLHMQSENSLVESLQLIEQMKQEMAQSNIEIRNLSENLAKAEVKISEFRHYSTDTVTKSKEKIDNLEMDVVKAVKISTETNDRNTKLQHEIEYLKGIVAKKDDDIQDLKQESRLLLKQINFSSPRSGNRKDMETQTDVRTKLNKSENNDVVNVGGDDGPIEHVVTEQGDINPPEIVSNDHQELNLQMEQPEDNENVNGPVEKVVKPDDINPPEIDHSLESAQDFVSIDEIVLECRHYLRKLPFGWMKFHKNNKSRYLPGFVHPPDADGREMAQHVTRRGYVTDKKFLFHDFHENLPDDKKKAEEIASLKKFNTKFKFSVS